MSEVNEKLIYFLRQNDVRISTKNNICLNDFVENIIESKNPNRYIKKLDYDQKIINNEPYISPDNCIDILKNTNRKKCKDIYTKILIDDGDNSSIIDVENQIFQFDGHKFLSFFVEKDEGDWDVWVKGSAVAKFLDYADYDQVTSEHVDDNNKCTFLNLCKLFNTVKNTGIKNIHPSTIFINISGFMNLIHCSKKPFAKKIKNWLDNDVVPSLIKYGTYTMQPKKLHIEFFMIIRRFQIFIILQYYTLHILENTKTNPYLNMGCLEICSAEIIKSIVNFLQSFKLFILDNVIIVNKLKVYSKQNSKFDIFIEN